MASKTSTIETHIKALKDCRRCPHMIGPVVTHGPVLSNVMLIGQAPGPKEGNLGKPFAWTAGKTLFSWFASIGVSEEQFRRKAYMSAVCRCFPGKTKQGGDRVPAKDEIANCSSWMEDEFALMSPRLVLPVGKLAIDQFLSYSKLTDVIGKKFTKKIKGRTLDLIPLPHPSGASTWFRREPGQSLLKEALQILRDHEDWRLLFDGKS
ncbi:MAG: uracil-DNA glycosylase family protein [Candidatus Obscuribacterales bacterium]|nr:uracil-DNA glycosylase family protein [Candidatus Obscuribacterales bacterium]